MDQITSFDAQDTEVDDGDDGSEGDGEEACEEAYDETSSVPGVTGRSSSSPPPPPPPSPAAVAGMSKGELRSNGIDKIRRESLTEQVASSEVLNDARRSSIDLTHRPTFKLVGNEYYPLRIALELLNLDRIKVIKGVDSETLKTAKEKFKSTKVLYIFPDGASVEVFSKKNKSNTFAPKWFEPEDYFEYVRNEYNTIVVGEEGIDLIIDFIAINCSSVQAIYSEVTLPFTHFTLRLGPRMSFFRGFSVKLRWHRYDMLKHFKNLQFMRGYGGPCYYQRLAHNLPVSVIDDFAIAIANNKCGGCIKRIFALSRERGIQVGRIRRGIPLALSFGWTNAHPRAPQVDSSFADGIKELTLMNCHRGQGFYFPNLLSLALRSPRHSVYFKSIEYSLNLRSLEFTLALNNKCLNKLSKLVTRLRYLKLFFVFNYIVEGNIFPDVKMQDSFLSSLVESCPQLENLILPFFMSITSVKLLIRLPNLMFIGVERFPMDSSIAFFSNTRGNKIKRITITEEKEETETFDGTTIVHSAFMKCYDNNRYNQININYKDTCLDDACPLKHLINTISSSIKLTHESE